MQVKNRNCIRRLSWRSLWASRKRNLIAVAAIALTTLLFTSLFTIAMSMNSSYQTYTFRQIGSCSHGSFKEVTEEQCQAIAAHRKVKAVGLRTVCGFISDGVFAKVPAEVSYMDENNTRWGYCLPTTGRMPESGKEVTMDTKALKLLGITPELGAKVELTFDVGDKNQKSGKKTDTLTLVGWWEYDDLSPVHFINVSKEYAESVQAEAVAQGLTPFRTDLSVMMASSVDIRGQMEQVDLDLGYHWEADKATPGNHVRLGVNWGYTTAQLDQGMDFGIVAGIAAFLALVMLTGYLIIYNIFQISVTGDIRFYGLLKTIGVTPRQLRRIIRQQALLLCLLGIPLGLALGYGVGAALTPVVLANTDLGSATTTISTSPLIFLASSLFALVTVLLSCARPGRLAAKVSPVEATKYTEVSHSKKKRRATRGARVYQMAFANLGRNKAKTVLVVLSLALSVVLLNLTVGFTKGFDMEKYLAANSCADFIVSSPDYFRYNRNPLGYFTPEDQALMEASTQQTLAGSGYMLGTVDTKHWISEEALRAILNGYGAAPSDIELFLSGRDTNDTLVKCDTLVEGLDPDLFEKLTVVDGDLAPLFQPDSHAIALVVPQDDYSVTEVPDYYPSIGSKQTILYIDDAYYIDSRTGERSDENTPMEYLQFHIAKSHDVEYTICAYVAVPYSMSYRYGNYGLEFVLPVEKLRADSEAEPIPMFYLFDTPSPEAEAQAEAFLAELTKDDLSELMYESKATVREEFKSFQSMFLLMGGLLCGIIGVVGILNFFNAIMTGILSRQREFAVLQAVGMTGKQLNTMLIDEGLFYTLGAGGFALVLSLLLNPLVGRVLEEMFWFFTARTTILPVLCTIPVFALLGWVIPGMAYHGTRKRSVVERLRETE